MAGLTALRAPDIPVDTATENGDDMAHVGEGVGKAIAALKSKRAGVGATIGILAIAAVSLLQVLRPSKRGSRS